MANVSSRHHGGDEGNEDPHGPPNRVHIGCKSSQPKKRRGHGKNLNLQAEWVKNGNKPIPIKFVHSTNLFKAVGKNASKFVRSISNELDETAPFQITSWDQVPKDYKVRLQNMLHHYFDLKSHHKTEHWVGINQGIMMDCASRFTSRRHNLKLHFDAVGGYDNVEEAKKNPPDNITMERWLQVIELFETKEFRMKSERNKANRAKQLYPSYHGSKSYVQRRHEEIEATGRANYIDGWREMHSRNGNIENIHAQNAWNKIEEERSRAMALAGEEQELNQVEVLQRSLGFRHGHTKGVGRKVKSIAPDVRRTLYEPPPEEINLYQMFLQQQQTISQLQQQINQLIANQSGASSSTQQHQEYEEDSADDDEH